MLKKIINKLVRQTELSDSPDQDYSQSNLNSKMAKITINGKEYDSENLSDEAKKQLQSLQFATSERQRLEALLAVTATAQSAYSRALQEELDKAE